MAVVLFFYVEAGLLAWLRTWSQESEPVLNGRVVKTAAPDKPSIAVLLFANLSDDPEHEYFSNGITDDMTTDLSRISGLFVASRNAGFSYKGKSLDISEISRDLGVKYVLEGSIRRVGDQIRINAQLTDAATGGHIWAQRFDGNMADVFALQVEVSGNHEDALESILRTKLLNPQFSYIYLAVEGRILFFLERYQESVRRMEESILRNPVFDRGQLTIAATYAELGRIDDAELAVEQALAIRPDITLASEQQHSSYKDPHDLERHLAALRKASVPE